MALGEHRVWGFPALFDTSHLAGATLWGDTGNTDNDRSIPNTSTTYLLLRRLLLWDFSNSKAVFPEFLKKRVSRFQGKQVLRNWLWLVSVGSFDMHLNIQWNEKFCGKHS